MSDISSADLNQIRPLEAALRSRLSTLSQYLNINAQDFIDPNNFSPQTGLVYDFLLRVGYKNTSYERPSGLENFGKQNATREFEVAIEMKDYVNKPLSQDLCEKVEQIIMEYEPLSIFGVIGGFFLQSSGFEKNASKGIYEYRVTCSIPVVIIKQNTYLGY